MGLLENPKSPKIPITVLLGSLSSRSAQAPATCGAAIEVPLFWAKLPPGTDEVMPTPGASRSTIGDILELEAMASLSVVEPTVIALDMHPGAPTASVKPPLPEPTTVAMPATFRLSIIALRSSVWQALVNRSLPRLKFAAAKLRVFLGR